MALDQIKNIAAKEWLWKGNEKLRKKDIDKFRQILEAEKAQLSILSGAIITPKTGRQFTVWDNPKKMKNGWKKLWVVKVDEEAEILEVTKVNWQFRFKVSFGEDGKEWWIYPQLWDGTPTFEIVEQEEPEVPAKVIPKVREVISAPKKDVITDKWITYDVLSPSWEKLPDNIKIVKKQWGDEIRAYIVWKTPIQLSKEVQTDGTIIFKDKEKKYTYNPKENKIISIEAIVSEEKLIIAPKENREETGDYKALEFLKSIAPGVEKVEDLNGKEFEFEWIKFKWSVQNKWEESKIFFEDSNNNLWIAFIIAKTDPIVLKWSLITSTSTTHAWLADAFKVGTTVEHLKSFIAFSKRVSSLGTEKKHEINNFLMQWVTFEWKKQTLTEEQIIEFIKSYNPENPDDILTAFTSNENIKKLLKVWLWIPILENSEYLVIWKERLKVMSLTNEGIVLVNNSKEGPAIYDTRSNSKMPIEVTPSFWSDTSETTIVHSFSLNWNTYSLISLKWSLVFFDTEYIFMNVKKNWEKTEFTAKNGKVYVLDEKSWSVSEKVEEKRDVGKLTLKKDSIVEVWETTDIIFTKKVIANLPITFSIWTSDEGKTYQLFSNSLTEGIKKIGKPFFDGSELNIEDTIYIFNEKESKIVKKLIPEVETTTVAPSYSYDEKAKTISEPKDGIYNILDIPWLPNTIKVWKQGNSFIAVRILEGNKVEKISISSWFPIVIDDTYVINTIKTSYKLEGRLEDGSMIVSSFTNPTELFLLLWDNKVLNFIPFNIAKSGIEEKTWVTLEKAEWTSKRIVVFATSQKDARVFLFPLTSFTNPIEISIEGDKVLQAVNKKLKAWTNFVCLKTKDGKYILGDMKTFDIIEWTKKYDSVSTLWDSYLLVKNNDGESIFDIKQWKFIQLWGSTIIKGPISVNGNTFEIGTPSKKYKLNEKFELKEIVEDIKDEKTVFQMWEVIIKQKWGKYMQEDYEVESENIGGEYVKIYSHNKKTFTIFKRDSQWSLSRTEHMEVKTDEKDFIVYKNTPLLVQKNSLDWFEFVSYILDGKANILLRNGNDFIQWEIEITDDTQIHFEGPKGKITLKVTVNWDNISISKV